MRPGEWLVDLENGKTIGALDVQWQFHELATKTSRSANAETDWLLESWSFTLDALETKPEALIGGVDWITKKWLLDTFMEAEDIDWNDPWLQSLDLEYHNIDPANGLFFGVTPAKRIGEWNNRVRRKRRCGSTRKHARSGRAQLSRIFRNVTTLCYQLGFDCVR